MVEFSTTEISAYYTNHVPNLKWIGAEGRGPCPIHKGTRDSFAVDLQTGLWICHACGRNGNLIGLEMALTGVDFRTAQAEVFRFLGRSATKNTRPSKQSGIVATYDYCAEDGTLLFQVCRLHPKSFRQRQPEGNGFRWGIGGIRRVLYRLPELLRRPDEPIYIVEGEKDVHSLEAGGLLATCNPMGAGKWRSEYSESIRGRSAVLTPDNDRVGRNHMADVACDLLRIGCEVRIVEVPHGNDVSDWLGAGGSIDELKSLAATQPVLTVESVAAWRTRGETRASDAEDDVPRVPGGTKSDAGPFQLTSEGLFYIDPDEEKPAVMICGWLEIAALTRDPVGDQWGRLVRWLDREKRAHQWAIPMSLLAGDGTEYRARLLDGGLTISPARKSRDLLTNYIQTTPVSVYTLCVSRLGWHGEVFVLPEETIGRSGTEDVIFQTPYESEHLFSVAGTVADWRDNVGRLCCGNSRLVLAASCAFAGPLLSPSGAESGGVHLHGASSTGKTTALVVGGSVLGGGGRNGFVQSWRSTANGLEAVAAQHNDLTLFLDELAQMDAKEVAETAYLLGNGSGKTRMSRSIGARKKLTWSLLFVSAGELTLADHAKTAGRRTKGGVEVRLLNIDADAGAGLGLFENIHGTESPDAFSRQLRDAAKRSYGAPIREYLAFVVANREHVTTCIANFQVAFVMKHVPPGASGEVFRAAQRFALIGAAGELATAAGITGWTEDESGKAAATCFQNWLARRVGGSGAQDAEAAIRQVRGFIEAHGASRFQSTKPRSDKYGNDWPEKVINRAGFRVDRDSKAVEYRILPEVFQHEVCQGFDHVMVASALRDRGYLNCEPPHLTKKRRLPELGNTRFYAIRSAILTD